MATKKISAMTVATIVAGTELIPVVQGGINKSMTPNLLMATKANIDSPTFTNTPSAPTAIVGTNTTQLATTAFVTSNSIYDRIIYSLLGSAVKGEGIMGSFAHMTASAPLVDQQIKFTTVYLPIATTITGVHWYQNTQGGYTADNFNGFGIYSYSAGTLTLIDTSNDADGSVWKSASGTWVKTPFIATHALTSGIYIVAALYNQSAETTAPVLGCYTGLVGSAGVGFDFANSYKINATLATQTTMPASKTMAQLSNSLVAPYFGLY